MGTGADQLLGSSRGEILYASGVETEVDRDIIDMAGGNDYVMLGNPARGTEVGPDVITLGGGRDVLAIFGPVAAATLAGGPGCDLLWIDAGSARGVLTTIDNRREQLRLDEVVVVRWSSFSHFRAQSSTYGPFAFSGSSRPERVWAFVASRWKVDVRMRGGRDRVNVSGGAGSRLDGGGGADVVESRGSAATIYGSGGNDRLIGSDDNDILIGGDGFDIADGSGGSDRCKAEVRSNCES